MTSDMTVANAVVDNPEGPGSLTKTGPGLLQIGTGSYTGITTVTGGMFQVGLGGSGVALETSQLANDGTVLFNHAGTLVVAGRLSGNGGFRKAGTGGLVITGGGPMDGPITVSSGSLVFAGQATLGPTADHRGGLSIAAGAQWIYRSTSPQTISGTVSGGGRVVADGKRLVLAGANTFTGTAAVVAGDLVLAADQALAAASVSVAAALAAGRGDGTWNGTVGITSSAVAADVAAGVPRTLGWLDNGDGSVTAAYAAPGDTNLDGGIDILDAANVFAGGAFDTGRSATSGFFALAALAAAAAVRQRPARRAGGRGSGQAPGRRPWS
ncbi:MAG: autotransporter-associated beta strand repeat-containing protein [Planctomycetaceae bacterium]